MPKSDGRVRLCVNYRPTVNPQLMDVNYPLPTPENLFARIKGAVFCKLDLRKAYQHLELEEGSRDLTTASTHRGPIRLLLLPYDIKSCCALFQQAMDSILAGLDTVCATWTIS